MATFAWTMKLSYKYETIVCQQTVYWIASFLKYYNKKRFHTLAFDKMHVMCIALLCAMASGCVAATTATAPCKPVSVEVQRRRCVCVCVLEQNMCCELWLWSLIASQRAEHRTMCVLATHTYIAAMENMLDLTTGTFSALSHSAPHMRETCVSRRQIWMVCISNVFLISKYCGTHILYYFGIILSCTMFRNVSFHRAQRPSQHTFFSSYFYINRQSLLIKKKQINRNTPLSHQAVTQNKNAEYHVWHTWSVIGWWCIPEHGMC